MIISNGQSKTKGGKINVLVIIAWFQMIFGTLAQLTAIATSYWRGNEQDFHEGIFQRCEGGDCQSVTFFNGEDGELDLVRILMLIGNFYMLLALFLNMLNIGPKTAGNVLRILSFLHNGTALSCYIYYFHDLPFLWSFYLFCAGIGLSLVGLIVMASVDVRKARDKDLPPDDSEGEEEEEGEDHNDIDHNDKK